MKLSHSYYDVMDSLCEVDPYLIRRPSGEGKLYGVPLSAWYAALNTPRAVDAKLEYETKTVLPVILGRTRIPATIRRPQ